MTDDQDDDGGDSGGGVGDDDYQKKIESESFFDFLSRAEQLWVSDFCLRSGEKVELSWEPTMAGVNFGMK